MKLRRSEMKQVVYLGGEEGVVPREKMLERVTGRPISESKALLARYSRAEGYTWTNRRGQVVAVTSPSVFNVNVKYADEDKRRTEYLQKLREALDKVTKPDVTPADMAEALRLQIEYLEFLSLLDD